jgi:hypothetical protein
MCLLGVSDDTDYLNDTPSCPLEIATNMCVCDTSPLSKSSAKRPLPHRRPFVNAAPAFNQKVD